MPVVDCPSGLKVELRGLTVAEEDLLLSMSGGSLKKSETAFKELLTRCLVGVVDPGPYPDITTESVPDVDDLLVGDRFALLVHLRILSYGPELEVRGTCPKGHSWEAVVDLTKMEMYELPEESKRKFKAGEDFSFVLPVLGRTVTFGLAMGAAEAAAAVSVLRGASDVASESLRMRIRSISGFDSEKAVDEESGMDIGSFIRSMPVADSSALREAMNEADCGMETEFESVCDVCDTHSWVSVENAVNFFAKGRGPKRRGSRALRS